MDFFFIQGPMNENMYNDGWRVILWCAFISFIGQWMNTTSIMSLIMFISLSV